MIKLLYIGHVWPEPDSSAAGSRTIALLDCFRNEGWEITFACAADESMHMSDLGVRGITSVPIKLNSACFDEFAQLQQPDVVVFDRFITEEQYGWRVAQQCPDAIRVLDLQDLHSLRDVREQAFKRTGELLAETPSELLAADIAKREIAAIYRSDLSLVISEFEFEILEEVFRIDPALLLYTPFMVPPQTSSQTSGLPDFDQRCHFISIGNFRHAPNWDAVQHLHDTLWPLIRAKIPSAQLHIYGAYPPKRATQLHKPQSGFFVRGWAENAYSVMQQARINLAPLRFGAGLKGKLLDGMVCGTPSITTSIGSEGMAGPHTWPGSIADDSESFANEAVRLYQDKPSWLESQLAGFAIPGARFSAEQHGRTLVDRIKNLGGNIQQHRLNNFTGSMLRHHTLRSTEYMSRWIAAKEVKNN